ASLGGGGDLKTALANGYAAIQRHETALAKEFCDGLPRLTAWRLWGIAEPSCFVDRVATFGLTHRTRTAAEIAAFLADRGIFTWAGHFYAVELIERLGLAPHGMLRIGFLHYNTAEEVGRTLEALAAIDD